MHSLYIKNGFKTVGIPAHFLPGFLFLCVSLESTLYQDHLYVVFFSHPLFYQYLPSVNYFPTVVFLMPTITFHHGVVLTAVANPPLLGV